MPKTAADLDGHDIIAYPPDVRAPIANVNWIMEVGDPAPNARRPILQVNSIYAIYRAVESGLGIAALPDFLVDGTKELTRVLPDTDGPKVDAYFVYAEELRHSKRIAVFRDFLVKKVAESAF